MAKYNGWKNYETWELATRVLNTEEIYNVVVDIVMDSHSYKETYKRLKALFPDRDKKVYFREIVLEFITSKERGDFTPRRKLTQLTGDELHKQKVFPLDVDDKTMESLNANYPKITLLNKYDVEQGRVVRSYDEQMFRLYKTIEIDFNIRNRTWFAVDGEYYDVDEIICKFTDAGFEIENDL